MCAGGGEYGNAWYRSRKITKRNTEMDLIACAGASHRHGRDPRHRLGIVAALRRQRCHRPRADRKRPDLFAAAPPGVRVPDAVRGNQANGAGNTMEFGKRWRRRMSSRHLLAMSAYHHAAGVKYPAVMSHGVNIHASQWAIVRRWPQRCKRRATTPASAARPRTIRPGTARRLRGAAVAKFRQRAGVLPAPANGEPGFQPRHRERHALAATTALMPPPPAAARHWMRRRAAGPSVRDDAIEQWGGERVAVTAPPRGDTRSATSRCITVAWTFRAAATRTNTCVRCNAGHVARAAGWICRTVLIDLDGNAYGPRIWRWPAIPIPSTTRPARVGRRAWQLRRSEAVRRAD